MLKEVARETTEPDARRRAVEHLCQTFKISERRACSVLDQPAVHQRLVPAERPAGKPLVQRMLELVRVHPRFGYHAASGALLRPRRLASTASGCTAYAARPQSTKEEEEETRAGRRERLCNTTCLSLNHVWAWDFIHDRTANERPLKWLSVVDEYTRASAWAWRWPLHECQARDRTVGRDDRERGAAVHIRSDNGPEFIAYAIRHWLVSARVAVLYVEPGSPWRYNYGVVPFASAG